MSADKGDRSLDILVIASQLPYPPQSGGLIRLYNLYRRLGKKHRLTWVCPIWPGNEIFVQEALRFCDRVIELPRYRRQPIFDRGWRNWLKRVVAHLHSVRLFAYRFGRARAPGLYWLSPTPERVALIEKVAGSSPFDLIVCEGQNTAELVPDKIDAPKVIEIFDMQSTLFRRARDVYDTSWKDRLLFWPELQSVIWYEKRNYARFGMAIVVSELDAGRLRSRCPDLPTEVIPNGADSCYFRPGASPGVPNSLVYVGDYRYPPNADAMSYFCREILPLVRQRVPDVHVWAVGHQPPAALSAYEGVQPVGFVGDVRPYLAEARVVIVPLRVGGGTRIKIVEALAMGKAVVSTSLGAEGLQVTPGHDILVADDPGDFADCVVRLLDQPELRARLGENGRRLAEQVYDWDDLATRLDSVFQELVRRYRGDKTTSQEGPSMPQGRDHASG